MYYNLLQQSQHVFMLNLLQNKQKRYVFIHVDIIIILLEQLVQLKKNISDPQKKICILKLLQLFYHQNIVMYFYAKQENPNLASIPILLSKYNTYQIEKREKIEQIDFNLIIEDGGVDFATSLLSIKKEIGQYLIIAANKKDLIQETNKKIKHCKITSSQIILHELVGILKQMFILSNVKNVSQFFKKDQQFLGKIAFHMYFQNYQNFMETNTQYRIDLLQFIKSSVLKYTYNSPFYRYSFVNEQYQYFLISKFIIRQVLTLNFPIFPLSIIKQKSIRYKIRQIFHKYRFLENKFMWIIYLSRIDKSIQNISAVAITILNLIGISFSGMDLSNISIPDAILVNGYFQNTNFQNCNLSNVIFDKSYLLNTKFNGSEMKGIKFQYEFFHQFTETIGYMDLDKQQKQLLVTFPKKIEIYEIKNMKKIVSWMSQMSLKQAIYLQSNNILIHADNYPAQIWNSQLSNNIIILNNYDGNVDECYSVIQSPQGKSVAIVLDYKKIILIDIETGFIIKQFSGKDLTVNALCYSPDEKYLVIGGDDNLINIWDLQTVTKKQILKGHMDNILSVCYSTNGKIIASSGYDQTIYLWNAQKGSVINILKGHDNGIYWLSYSVNNQLISCSWDNSIRIWDQQGRNIDIFKNYEGYINAICLFHSSNKIISSTQDNNMIKIWNQKNLSLMKQNQQDTYRISSIFVNHQNLIICSSYDKTIKIFNQEGLLLKTIPGHENAIINSCLSFKQKLFATLDSRSIFKLWNTATFLVLKRQVLHKDAVRICFCSDDKMIAVGFINSTIMVWDYQNNQNRKILKGHLGMIKALCSMNSQKIISGSADYTLIIWNILQERNISTFIGHQNTVESIDYSAINMKIISGSRDTNLILWQTKTNDKYILKGHQNSVTNVKFSSDGKKIVSGGDDKLVILWSVAQRMIIKIFQGHFCSIRCICFSLDSNSILSGSSDQTIKLWKIKNSESKQQNSIILQNRKYQHNLVWSKPQNNIFLKNLELKNIRTDNLLLQKLRII